MSDGVPAEKEGMTLYRILLLVRSHCCMKLDSSFPLILNLRFVFAGGTKRICNNADAMGCSCDSPVAAINKSDAVGHAVGTRAT